MSQALLNGDGDPTDSPRDIILLPPHQWREKAAQLCGLSNAKKYLVARSVIYLVFIWLQLYF